MPLPRSHSYPQYGGLVYTLTVYVGLGIATARRHGDNSFGVGYDAMPG